MIKICYHHSHLSAFIKQQHREICAVGLFFFSKIHSHPFSDKHAQSRKCICVTFHQMDKQIIFLTWMWLNEPCILPFAWRNLNSQHCRQPHKSNCQNAKYNLLRNHTKLDWLQEITENVSMSSLVISLKLCCLICWICDRTTSGGKQGQGLLWDKSMFCISNYMHILVNF